MLTFGAVREQGRMAFVSRSVVLFLIIAVEGSSADLPVIAHVVDKLVMPETDA